MLRSTTSSVRGASTIIAVDLHDHRLALSLELGATHTLRGDDADLATKIEAAEALTYRAAEHYNHERYVTKEGVSFNTTKLISMAKVFVVMMGRGWVNDMVRR